jgi:hypothetical protein
VQDDLRAQAETLTDARPVWRWEEYKHARYLQLSQERKALALTLDKARWLIFLIPSVIALVAYATLVDFEDWRFFLWLGVDIQIMVTAFYVLLLADETRGLPFGAELETSGPVAQAHGDTPPTMVVRR